MIVVFKDHEGSEGQQVASVGGRDQYTLTCLVPVLNRAHYKNIL